ncbi:MAG: YoaK family protein [Methanoregula sp.]|jgi:uncharacterized membrane protein YoaK (UPF0700 family)
MQFPGKSPLIRAGTGLAFVGGFMDALTFLFIGGVFSGMMTGNLILLGVGLVAPQVSFIHPWVNAIAIGAFVLGVALAGLLPFRPGRGRALVAAEIILLSCAAAALFSTGPAQVSASGTVTHSTGTVIAIVCAAGAMGIQTTLINRIGSVPVSTTFMTSTLIRIVTDFTGRTAACIHRNAGPVVSRSSHEGKAAVSAGSCAGVLIPILGAFFIGAVSSALLTVTFGYASLSLPVAALVILAVTWDDVKAAQLQGDEPGQRS